MRPSLAASLPFLMCIAACSGVTYENQKKHEAVLTGEVAVFWLAEGDQTEGDGKFIYVPIKSDPLVLTWWDGNGQQRKTQPGIMFTDGGSIPKLAQGIEGYSPWGFAPAFMVHDWVFEAKQCVRDNDATEEQQKAVEGMEFDDTVRIMAQAIYALERLKLVSDKGSARSGITAGVGTPFSRQRWETAGDCDNSDGFTAIAQKYDAIANGPRGLVGDQGMIRILTQTGGGRMPKLIGRMSF